MEENLKDRITKKGREKFFSMGFSKVTMDEIALDLGISKKTLYKHFASKDDLLQAVMEWQMITVSGKFKEIYNAPVDFLEKLHNLWSFVGGTMSQISKQFQDDLRRFRPDLWKRVNDFRREQIMANISKFFDEGIRLGFLRDDINRDILVLVYLSAVQGIINPDVLVNHPFTGEEAFKTIISVIFDGILTDQARQQFGSKFHEQLLRSDQATVHQQP